MKTLNFIANGNCSFGKPVIVDFNKNDVTQLDNTPSGIDYMFVAPEDIEVRYKVGTKTRVLNANKGDLIITFYKHNSHIKNYVIVVKNKEWKDNVASMLAEQAAEQTKSEKLASMCCDDCEYGVCCSKF